jgi:chorismate synthase
MTLRLITAGESHGPGLTCIVEGLPAGLPLRPEDLNEDMARRQLGHGRGGRMKIEKDTARVTGGIRHGVTLGGPIALQVENRDYANWEERMSPWPVGAEVAEVPLPRPGHADLVGTQKYKQTDVRNILERASARETAARVAGGALCKAFLGALGVQVRSHVIQIASVHAPERTRSGAPHVGGHPEEHTQRAHTQRARGGKQASEQALTLTDFDEVDSSPVRCLDAEAGRAMVAEIDALRKANESLGGVFEVQSFGLHPGLGSHVSWEQRLDGRLAMGILSIQAIKGVAIGDGFAIAGVPGSQAHDEIFYSEQRGYYRETNRCGGLEGGMTTGEPLIVRGAMKPLPTLTKPLRSVDISTHEPAEALRERTDSCTVPAAGVVGEAMVALVLADAYRRKFGGDHIDDVRQALDAYCERIGWPSP